MSNLREPYIAAARAGLQSRDGQESAVTRIAAAGRCSATGIDVWRAAYGLEGGALARLRRAMLKAFRARYPREAEAERVVDQAIHEYCGPGCTECEGTGYVGAMMLDAPRAICPTCSGHKIRHYTDSTRATMMQLSFAKTKHLAHKIGWVIKQLSVEDKTTNHNMNIELGRYEA